MSCQKPHFYIENAQEMVNACSERVSSVVGEFQFIWQAPCESGWDALDKKSVAATDPFKFVKPVLQQLTGQFVLNEHTSIISTAAT